MKDGVFMRRITDDEIAFYNGVAERISNVLGSPSCSLTQGSLARRIGWNRASLCNFINRIDKGIAAHFIPRIAVVLGVSTEHLIAGERLKPQQRNVWDPRVDEADVILDKFGELQRRELHSLSLTSVLPLQALPHHAMVANFVNSMMNGASAVAAERWHDVIERERDRMLKAGCENIDYLIPMQDLLRLPRRLEPYQAFSSGEVIYILENLKKEWIRKRGMRIIAVGDAMLDPDTRLELSGNVILSVLGREIQVRFHRDLRIHWDDAPNAVNASRECLVKLKRAAGFGVHDRPSVGPVERLADMLLEQAELYSRLGSPSSRNGEESRLGSAGAGAAAIAVA
jgi:hypothetical protein